MKREELYDVTTIGGRIHELREKKGITRKDLYFTIRPDDTAAAAPDDSSINTMVRRYETNKTKLNAEQLASVCRLLGCSADYLLGLEEYTAKENKDIAQKTGLTDKSIEKLAALFERDKRLGFGSRLPGTIGLINEIIISNTIEASGAGRSLKILEQYEAGGFPEESPRYKTALVYEIDQSFIALSQEIRERRKTTK